MAKEGYCKFLGMGKNRSCYTWQILPSLKGLDTFFASLSLLEQHDRKILQKPLCYLTPNFDIYGQNQWTCGHTVLKQGVFEPKYLDITATKCKNSDIFSFKCLIQSVMNWFHLILKSSTLPLLQCCRIQVITIGEVNMMGVDRTLNLLHFWTEHTSVFLWLRFSQFGWLVDPVSKTSVTNILCIFVLKHLQIAQWNTMNVMV